jgi:hypothetical protein
VRRTVDGAPAAIAGSLAVLLLMTVGNSSSAEDRDDKKNAISDSVVQQGFAASPIPFDKLKLAGKDGAAVALGSYLVNGAADCNGCHTFPRFLRPGGTVPGTNPVGNATGNVAGLGSNPQYGNPYLDTVPTTPDGFEPLNGQLKANTNADTTHGIVTHTATGVPIYPYNHFLAGGRCFGFFMSRNLTPDDSGKPRGLTEAEFIQVMRQGKDISCSKQNPPTYGGVPDPVCSIPEGRGAGVSFNPNVLQTMSWPTYHSMTDTDLKAIYAYLSALPQSKACNTVDDGCAGFFGAAQNLGVVVNGVSVGVVGANQYAYPNTDDCPKNGNNSAPPQ